MNSGKQAVQESEPHAAFQCEIGHDRLLLALRGVLGFERVCLSAFPSAQRQLFGKALVGTKDIGPSTGNHV